MTGEALRRSEEFAQRPEGKEARGLTSGGWGPGAGEWCNQKYALENIQLLFPREMYWKGKRLVAGMLVRIGQNKMNQVNKMKHQGVGVSSTGREREGREGPKR